MHYVSTRLQLLLCLCSIILMASTCENTIDNPPKPSDFNKEHREQLGNLIQIAIQSDSETFPILANTAPYDSAYWYVQTLYNQVTNEMRLDRQSTSTDRWDMMREWSVTILDQDDVKTAFSIPGGYFYISTGLLKSLQEEYELYYILAFEALLMNERFVLNRLISEYNTAHIENIIFGTPSPNTPSTRTMANVLADMVFGIEDIGEVDGMVGNLICKSSVFDRTGIIPILDSYLNNADKWLQTRPSYEGRSDVNYLLSMPIDDKNDCGNYRTNSGYQKYVLDKLPQ